MIDQNTFYSYFTKDKLHEQFDEKIRKSSSAGLDRVSYAKFNDNRLYYESLISDTICNGNYSFTKYLELLISKGRGKAPRLVSRPTIKDKLTLSMLHTFLQESYPELDHRLIHTKINTLIQEIKCGKFTHFIKIDIKGFYSNIDHVLLRETLSERLPECAISIIENAIKTKTMPKDFNTKINNLPENNKGVPEGLSISNILADIYLFNLDSYFESVKSLFYCRYVDDILVLCDEKHLQHIKRDIHNCITDLHLQMNEEKLEMGSLDIGFNYLGYYFNSRKISVRNSSVNKFEHNLERLFSDCKREKINLKLFEWKLNLKITGCISENRKYGWLFFYSQINDITLLKHMDWLIKRLLCRFHINQSDINIKSFVKSFYEIRFNLHASNYLIYLDRLNVQDKKTIIEKIYRKTVGDDASIINDIFYKLVKRDLIELEKDIQFFS